MKPDQGLNRRKFLVQTACGAGLLGTFALSPAQAAERDSAVNIFAYDVEKYAKTDPKLIGYEELTRFPAAVTEPRRVIVGPKERLWVSGNGGVAVLERDGAKVTELPTANARCLAVAPDGTAYVGVRDHIEVFDPQGRVVKQWESPGRKTWFTGLAVGESDLFAADSGGRVIFRYDRAGKLVGRIGEKNKERNVPGLVVPSPYLDVELAKDGLLRVNNTGRHRVEVYTVDGDFELCWGKPSAAIEGFCGCCNPIALALLPDGRCVTCEKGLPRVKVYSADGKFECVVAGTESFPENAKGGSARNLSDGTMGGLDATVDAEGKVYILDLAVGDVRVMKRKAQA
jgi:hypothetical protein